MIKAVIFDLDGVIVSTDHYHYLAWKKMAEKENIYFDEKINKGLRGVSRKDSLNIILQKASKEYSDFAKETLMKFKNDSYLDSLSVLSPKDLLKNVLVVLETLKKKGIKIAIGSSSKNAKYILKKIGLNDFFDAVIDGNDIQKSKPDPEVFIKAYQALGVAGECGVVEDAEAGIIAANSAKMLSFAVNDAKKSPYAYKCLDDIIQLLEYV